MALTRKMLAAMSIEEPQIEQIIEAHAETVTALKDRISAAEEKAGKADELEQELASFKAKQTDSGELQAQYNELQKSFENYKTQVEQEKAQGSKTQLYASMLRELGIDEKRVEKIMKVTDVSGYELENGALKDLESIKATASEDWAEFIPTIKTDGAGTKTPPQGGGNEDLSKLDDKAALKLMRERGY